MEGGAKEHLKEFLVASEALAIVQACPALADPHLGHVIDKAHDGEHGSTLSAAISQLDTLPMHIKVAHLPGSQKPDLTKLCSSLANVERLLPAFVQAVEAALKEPAALSFTTAAIQGDPSMRRAFHGIIGLSKLADAELSAKAAGAAASLLNIARVPLSCLNWRGVHLQGANLQNAILVQTNLSEAILILAT